MRTPWTTIVITICLIGLLTLFAGLQYYLLRQHAEARRDQLERRVQNDTARMANELDRDIQSLSVSLQGYGDLREQAEADQFTERYAAWYDKSPFPDLVESIVFVPAGEERVGYYYDTSRASFVERELDRAVLEALEQEKNESALATSFQKGLVLRAKTIHRRIRLNTSANITFRRAIGTRGEPTVALLASDRFGGDLLVFMSQSTLRERILPELAKRYFPDGDFDLAVLSKDNESFFSYGRPVTAADAESPILGGISAGVSYVAARTTSLGVSGIGNEGAAQNGSEKRTAEPQKTTTLQGKPIPDGSPVSLDRVIEREAFSGTLEVYASNTSPGDTRIFSATEVAKIEPFWNLKVQHTSGSVATFVDSETNKSLLLGLVIYLLITGSILAIVFSSLRARRFAQRQVDFVSSVSHEFRTPLAVLYSAGENLADGVATDAEQVRRYGDLVKNEGRKLSDMVEQILQFAGARGGGRTYNMASASISDVIDDALKECSGLLEEKGFELDSVIDPELPEMNVDATALSGAVQNLLINAVKYSNGERSIGLAARKKEDVLEISVEDKGIGISPKDLKHIFEPFFRSKQVVDAQIHGNGLGLALVCDVVRAHNGKVRAESVEGKGSKFTIELPL